LHCSIGSLLFYILEPEVVFFSYCKVDITDITHAFFCRLPI